MNHLAYQALICGDANEAIRLYREDVGTIPRSTADLYLYARLLQETDQRQEMLFCCESLLNTPEHCLFAAFQTGQSLVEAGTSIQEASTLVARHAAARYQDLVANLLSNAKSIEPMPSKVRHIAICATSFSGSTLLDRLLNGRGGMASIGESHWLTKGFNGSHAVPLDFTNLVGREVPQCSYCQDSCQTLTPEFRSQLSANPKDWYFRIAQQLNTDILVSADKNLPKIVLNDPKLRFDALILFKSPREAWRSEFSKRKFADPRDSEEQLRLYMRQWCAAYEEMLSRLKPRGTKLYLNFDWLRVNPKSILSGVLDALDIPFDPAALEKAVPGHSIGGNAAAMRRLREREYRVEIEGLSAVGLPESHLSWINSQPEIVQLYEALCIEAVRSIGPATSTVGRSRREIDNVANLRGEQSQRPVIEDAVRFTLAPFPIQTIPAHWLEGIFQDFGQRARRAADAIGETDRRGLKVRQRFYRQLADNFDSNLYGDIQKRHLVQEAIPGPANELKYFDTIRWIEGKLDHAAALNLHETGPLDILDLGTGPGHFQLVAEHFGHKTVGLDMPLRPRSRDVARHHYDELCDFFRVKKHAFKIEAMKPLPTPDRRFDLVTSFMTWFNSHSDNTPWSRDEWIFFLRDIRDNQLKPGGRLYMNLVAEAISQDVWTFLVERASTAVEKNRTLLFECFEGF